MNNPNIKRNIATASAATVALLGGAALKISSDLNNHPKQTIMSHAMQPKEAPHETLTVIPGKDKIVPKLYINYDPIEEIDEGSSTDILEAKISSTKAEGGIKQAKFSLVKPKKLPHGVKLSKTTVESSSTHTGLPHDEEILTTITSPAKPNLPKGIIEVDITATTVNGDKSTVEEPVRYVPQPERPS